MARGPEPRAWLELCRMHRSSSSATLAAFCCTIVLSAAALFAAGALLCTYTGRKWWWSGARQVSDETKPFHRLSLISRSKIE